MQKTCCFIGHKNIKETEELKNNICKTIETLILKEKVDTFLFGSKSRFNDLCYEIVTEIKEKYPNIKRIYVRAEYPIVNDTYKAYMLKFYEDTYYPEKILNAGKAIYVERNHEMIKSSHFCVFYYDESSTPTSRKSGTKIAFEYAKKSRKEIIRL